MKATFAPASHESGQPRPQGPHGARPTGAAGLLALATLVAGVVVGARPDIASQSALSAFLETDGTRLFVAWLTINVSGLAWVCFVVGIRALLPVGLGRDLFTFAAVTGQAATWIGWALETATAPQGAHDVPLPVYTAFGEAGHLAGATGMAATGLALMGMASALRSRSVGWPRWVPGATTAAGVLLVLGAVVGPASLPVLLAWTVTMSFLLMRRGAAGDGS
jgi:predicted small integral membrane protein